MPGATVTVMEDMRKDWITLEPGKVRENPFILMDVVKQQDALLKLGIVHCDLRYPNILTRENQTRLIDLESLTCRPSSVQCIDSIDLAWSQSCVAGLCETAVWQISLLLGQAFAKDIRDRQNFVEWLTENQNVALFRLALDVENNGVIDTIDLVEVVGEAVRAL
jgi:tRNA A-37 threonylcarbamoyl transferase component Bud32